jgi:hypothetical protein
MFAVKHCRVSVLAVNSVAIIFKLVNMGDKQRTAGVIPDPEHMAAQHLLSFSEFTEAVIRLAHIHSCSNTTGCAQKALGPAHGEPLSKSLGEFIEHATLHARKLEPDDFRRVVFQAELHDVITEHHSLIAKWHASFNASGHRAAVLSLKDYFTALEAAGWIDGYVFVWALC